MRIFLLSLLLLTACLNVACSRKPAPTLMTFDAADKQENNEKQIALEGYLRLPVMASVSDDMVIELHETADEKSRYISVAIPIGSSANQMEKPPKSYKDDDLKVHTNDGAVVGIKDKIRISGEFCWWPGKKGAADRSMWMAAPVVIQKL